MSELKGQLIKILKDLQHLEDLMILRGQYAETIPKRHFKAEIGFFQRELVRVINDLKLITEKQ